VRARQGTLRCPRQPAPQSRGPQIECPVPRPPNRVGKTAGRGSVFVVVRHGLDQHGLKGNAGTITTGTITTGTITTTWLADAQDARGAATASTLAGATATEAI